MRLSAEIWHSGKRYIPKDKAKDIIDPDRPWDTNLFKSILEEDLLLTRNAIGTDEIVDFTFDLMGDYLLAQYLLEEKTVNQVVQYLTTSNEFSLLINDKNRPRRNGILRCIAIMLPEKVDKYFFEILPESSVIRNVSEAALFEIEQKLINKDAVEWLTQRFKQDDKLDKQRILKRLSNTINLPDHPFNSKYTGALIRELSKVQRDLVWTEWLRKEFASAFDILKAFENVCSQEQIDNEKEGWLALTFQYIIWFLTTTNKDLRDYTTRALYKYGCRFRQQFFTSCEELFSVNDPYVVERILAAAYGVSMAFPDSPEVQQFALKVYDNFFKEGAPNATTHLIIRDYTRHLIDAAVYYKPDLLTEAQKKRTKTKLANDSKAALGFGPVDKEFARDILGSISSERSFRSTFPSLKESMAKLIWRVKELGYDSFKFHDIEKSILSNWNTGRGEFSDKSKFERYNRKYCWIALFELAGYYADTFEVIDEKRNFLVRCSDIDIDPSFPQLPFNYKVIDKDFLGDRSISFEDWINNEFVPNIDEYLVLDEIAGQKGPWVLLDGHIFQEDTEINRGISVFPRGLLFQKFEAENVLEYLKKNDLSNIWFPEIPHSYTTFAGEIPWCETFPYNGISLIELIISSEKQRVSDTVTKFFRGEEAISEEISFRLLSELSSMKSDAEKESYLNDLGIQKVESETYQESVVYNKQNFDTFVPVLNYSWDSRHSSLNPAQSAYVLSKDIAESLKLIPQPQTFNLKDNSGQIASFTIKWGEKLLNSHQLIYLRKDLLDKYLEKNSLSLLWAIYGEQEYRTADFEKYEQYAKENKTFSFYQNILAYNLPVKKQVTPGNYEENAEPKVNESSWVSKFLGKIFGKKK
jgi:hypothetical protein